MTRKTRHDTHAQNNTSTQQLRRRKLQNKTENKTYETHTQNKTRQTRNNTSTKQQRRSKPQNKTENKTYETHRQNNTDDTEQTRDVPTFEMCHFVPCFFF